MISSSDGDGAQHWRDVRSKARAGDADAAFLLASAYEEGRPSSSCQRRVPRNAARAFFWYGRAAAFGDPCAQLQLGNMLREGLGCVRDTTAALRWYKRALRRGYNSAANNIAVLYRDHGNTRRAIFWLSRAAEGGDDDALVDLGKALYLGKGVRRHLSRAVACFRKAYRSSSATAAAREEAAYWLGMAYRDGASVRRSITRAMSWLRKAATSGQHARAKGALASVRGSSRVVTECGQ